MRFLLKGLQSHLHIWGSPIKNTTIPMFPKDPCTQDAQGVKAFSMLLLNSPFGLLPPISEHYTPCGHQSILVHGLQNGKPKLPSKDTRSQDVLDGFLLLITKRAAIWVWEASFLQAVSSPTSIPNIQPHKCFTFSRGPGLPHFLPWFKGDGTDKEVLIG